ncbi:MAG: DUF4838 domain-containing protein [Lentisphaerota bacterium]
MKRILMMLFAMVALNLHSQTAELSFSLNAGDWKGSPRAEMSFYLTASGTKVQGLALTGPGKWRLESKFTAGKAQNMAIHFHAAESGSMSIGAKSGNREFLSIVDFSPGEQLKIIPFGIFTKQGAGLSRERLDEVSIELKSNGKIIVSWAGFSDKLYPAPGRNLWMMNEISHITPVATAMPLYAIVSDIKCRDAAAAMQKWLLELSGINLPVKLDGEKISEGLNNVILIGKDAVIKSGMLKLDELKRQGFSGFIVKICNSSLGIAGESVQGTNYGIYKFLEKQGLKFFAADVFSKKSTAKNILTAVDFSGRPFFDGRRKTGPYCIYGENAANTLGDPRQSGIDAVYPCDETLWLDHTAAFLVPKKIYIKGHPEYYILRGDGKRMPEDIQDVRLMLCQSSKEGIKIAAERALKWIASQNDRKFFVIQQGDDMEMCICPDCQANRSKGWNESDLLINWINSIARIVAKKYPDKYLVCYAYVNTQPAPHMLSPEKNVLVLYCPWPTKLSAPDGFRAFDAPENIIAGKQLRDWIAIAGAANLGLYDYNGGEVLTLRGMANRVKWCAGNGMKGGFWYCGQNQTFEKLFVYVNSQLNWDPFQDTSALEKEFISVYYGQAAPVMMKIIESVYDRLDADDRNKGRIPCPEFFSKEFTVQLLAWFDEVLKIANDGLKAEIAQDQYNIIINGICSLSPVGRSDVTVEQFDTFCLLLKKYISMELEKYKHGFEVAKNNGKPAPDFKRISDFIWQNTNVKIDWKEIKSGQVPPLLLELEQRPNETIRKYQITSFVEKLPDGSLLIPAMAFKGGEGPAYYKWKCEGKIAVWVRGAMTERCKMQAEFKLDQAPNAVGSWIEIEGQDSDKLSCPAAPVRITCNKRIIFEGANNFVKHGWSVRKFKLEPGILRQGDNQIVIENLANSDSQTGHWFMISKAMVGN